MSGCVNHFNRPVRVNLDGDDLCQECADAWARGEGQHAAWLEAQEAEHADTTERQPSPRDTAKSSPPKPTGAKA